MRQDLKDCLRCNISGISALKCYTAVCLVFNLLSVVAVIIIRFTVDDHVLGLYIDHVHTLFGFIVAKLLVDVAINICLLLGFHYKSLAALLPYFCCTGIEVSTHAIMITTASYLIIVLRSLDVPWLLLMIIMHLGLLLWKIYITYHIGSWCIDTKLDRINI